MKHPDQKHMTRHLLLNNKTYFFADSADSHWIAYKIVLDKDFASKSHINTLMYRHIFYSYALIKVKCRKTFHSSFLYVCICILYIHICIYNIHICILYIHICIHTYIHKSRWKFNVMARKFSLILILILLYYIFFWQLRHQEYIIRVQ